MDPRHQRLTPAPGMREAHAKAQRPRRFRSPARLAALGFTLAALLVMDIAPAAAPPGPGAPLQKGPVTNRVAPVRPAFRTNAAPAVKSGTGTNALAKKERATGTSVHNTIEKLKAQLRQFRSSQAFYPAIVGTAILLLLGVLFWTRRAQKRAATAGKQVSVASRVPAKAARVQACNVLEIGPRARQVWQFDARRFSLNREHTIMEGEGLPALVRKDWRALFNKKLNIVWLPPEHVFLRAIQLPRSDFAETLSMVELQLEKLSPMPVAQIVWSIQILPHAEGALETVIVMIVSRAAVEEFLGNLEAQGYLADRLELPLLDQLQTTPITEDGAWIYPEVGGSKNTALVAWWYGGVLQNLDLVTLTAEDHAGSLKEQLMQMAWAGEMEGWLASPPDWHLVADAVLAAQWEPELRTALEQPIEVVTPLAPRELAALTARRAATSDPRASLLPLEYAERYQQQFVDRLWMRGLLAVAGVYIIGVAIYMVALGFASYRTGKVETQVAQLGPTYTNAMLLKARYQVLKDRQELKYAALDCWNATAQNLPENATLTSLNFNQGKRLVLNGTAPADAIQKLYDFEGAMRKVTIGGQPLFDPARGGLENYRITGPTATWSLNLELKRSEAE